MIMGCRGVHCPGCGDHGSGGSGGRLSIGAGTAVIVIVLVFYVTHQHAIDHAADVVIDTLVIAALCAAGLAVAGLGAVLAVAGLRHRSARLAARSQRPGLAAPAYVRAEVLARPESHAAPLDSRPVLRALPGGRAGSAGRSALRPGSSEPARVRRDRTWPHLR